MSEGDVCKDDKTLLMMSNLPPPPKLAAHPDITRRNALTFDPSPPLKEEEYSVAAPNDQAELMCWHYCLNHVPFSKLKRLATNGKIPQRLASVHPPCPC